MGNGTLCIILPVFCMQVLAMYSKFFQIIFSPLTPFWKAEFFSLSSCWTSPFLFHILFSFNGNLNSLINELAFNLLTENMFLY